MKGKDLLFERAAVLNPSKNHRPNPSLRSMRSYLESNQILMKITDKNLGIAAISRSWYLEQCDRLLSDAKTYDQVCLDEVLETRKIAMERIVQIIDQSNTGEDVRNFLLSSSELTSIPEFHGIPKVHKTPWKLRPIVPCHSWVTRRASELCDYALRTFHRKWFPWVVDSSREVIRRMEQTTVKRNEAVWMITGDVESFYTNVDVSNTIKVLREGLDDLDLSHGVDPITISHLVEVVMWANCFGFNGQYFRQKHGIAMGTACAPAFANSNLGTLEIQVEEIVNHRDNKDGLVLYLRYIDDILMVFKGTETARDCFLEKLSSKLQPFTISWNIESTSSCTSFLDIEFFFEGRFGDLGLQSRVFRKRLNRHQYIPWSSAHPLSVKRAFVKAELTRFMILSSKRSLFEERRTEFYEALGRRGYPSNTLDVWKKLVKYEDRAYHLSKVKEVPRGLPLMLPSDYDQTWEYVDLKAVFETMRKEWANCGELLPETLLGPLIKSLRRTDNLFDKLSSWNKAILKGEVGTTLAE